MICFVVQGMTKLHIIPTKVDCAGKPLQQRLTQGNDDESIFGDLMMLMEHRTPKSSDDMEKDGQDPEFLSSNIVIPEATGWPSWFPAVKLVFQSTGDLSNSDDPLLLRAGDPFFPTGERFDLLRTPTGLLAQQPRPLGVSEPDLQAAALDSISRMKYDTTNITSGSLVESDGLDQDRPPKHLEQCRIEWPTQLLMTSTLIGAIETSHVLVPRDSAASQIIANLADRASLFEGVLAARGEIRLLRMKLRPEELGDVEVILRSSDSRIRVQFFVSHDTVFDGLSHELDLLKDQIASMLALKSPAAVFITVQATGSALIVAAERNGLSGSPHDKSHIASDLENDNLDQDIPPANIEQYETELPTQLSMTSNLIGSDHISNVLVPNESAASQIIANLADRRSLSEDVFALGGEIRLLRMKLRPEELGDVEVVLRSSDSGMKIQIFVSHESVVEGLSHELDLLGDRVASLLALKSPAAIVITVQATGSAQTGAVEQNRLSGSPHFGTQSNSQGRRSFQGKNDVSLTYHMGDNDVETRSSSSPAASYRRTYNGLVV